MDALIIFFLIPLFPPPTARYAPLKLWLVSTGECLQTFIGHQGPVMVAQFSPDAQFIV